MKELAAFYKDTNFKDGHKSTCKACEKITKHAWYVKNREISIQRAKQYRIDHPDWDKKVNLHANRSEFHKSWRDRHPNEARLIARRSTLNRRLKKYGLTLESYLALREQQGDVCAVCGEVPQKAPVRMGAEVFDNFVIDHDHLTNKVRGLTCSSCNVAIGMLRDSSDRARKVAIYLDNHSPSNSGLEVHLIGSNDCPLDNVSNF